MAARRPAPKMLSNFVAINGFFRDHQGPIEAAATRGGPSFGSAAVMVDQRSGPRDDGGKPLLGLDYGYRILMIGNVQAFAHNVLLILV